MNQGMQDEAAIYGVELVILDPAFDPQKQVSMIDNLIAQGVDALLVNAVDPAAVVPSLKKASEAGIPVIMNNADTNEEGHQYTETFVTTDTYGQGRAVGEAIKAVMEPNSKMAIISGKRDSLASRSASRAQRTRSRELGSSSSPSNLRSGPRTRPSR